MNPLVSKIVKVFLIVSVAALALLLVFGIVLVIGWPWWAGFFVLVGLAGIGIGLVFLKKILLQRREESFVHQIIEQDEAQRSTLGDKEKDVTKDLSNSWKEAIDALRNSHLKKQGNPLYVLPWYMIIGESGSGKTTAIESARLSSPFAEVTRTSGISGTKNCDWWFFEQAIIIDTAGRYAIPVDEGRDKEEWEKFLSLLLKYRKKEPLNGLVITIAANKLMADSPESLEAYGQSIRKRIDELMRTLGAKFPVYALVTKCDLIQGMTQFCDQLPDNALDQAMGHLNQDRSTDVLNFTDKVLQIMGERLKNLRLFFLQKSRLDEGQDPGLLLFPEEFERMRSGLNAFVKGAFHENPYQETPVLRGLYFSSGRQEGSPYSHFLNSLGLIGEQDVLPGTSKGLFLHDFFSKILPKDRKLFRPTQQAIALGQLTRNLGLMAWIAIAVSICGLLSFSFVKNLATLREVTREYTSPPVLQGSILEDVMTMDRFRQTILKVEAQNENWWIPRFGLNESEYVEEQLAEKYCIQFKEGFLEPLDRQMTNDMTSFSAGSPDDLIGRHVVHLARRINLLKAFITGEAPETVQTMPPPSFDSVGLSQGQTLIPEMSARISELYLYYLSRQSKTSILNKEMNDLQTWLKHILTLEGSRLNWIAAWVNSDPSLSDLTLEDFWGGSLPISPSPHIPPAFTLKGKAAIESLVMEVESAMTDPLMIAAKKLEFMNWYRIVYLDSWYAFGEAFSGGVNKLKGREEWQHVISGMTGGKGPYFSLLDMMAVELEQFSGNDPLPAWLQLVFEWKSIKDEAAKLRALQDKKGLAKISKKGKKLMTTLERKMSHVKTGQGLESQLAAAKALNEYQAALSEIYPMSASRRVAFQTATEYFKGDPAVGNSPFFKASRGVNSLRAAVTTGKSAEKMFWKLVRGPYDFMESFVITETACHLQDKWEKEVLVEVQDISDKRKLNKILWGMDGIARNFISGPASPFISRSVRKGYYGVKALDGEGGSIDFNNAFLTYLVKGAKSVQTVKDNYFVSIKGLPTETNPGASIKPHATRLEVQCSDKSFQLENFQFPIQKTIKWSPNTCGDVVFHIEVGDLILTKNYSGNYAFAEFLNDFSKGHRVFFPGEFPDKARALKRLGIKYIKAKYRFSGHKPVVKLHRDASPGGMPEEVAKCWDQ